MSTSVKTLQKHLLWNVAGSLFLALFGAIYELFSHGVVSYFMIYAFAIPLALGVLPYGLMLIFERLPKVSFLFFRNAAIAVLSVGSLFAGVLKIYGTTNGKVIVYPIAGALLLIISMIQNPLYRKAPSE